MRQPKIHYTSHERNKAKAFLKANGTVRTELDSERHGRWSTLDGIFWIEYDDPPFYTLYLESLQNTEDMIDPLSNSQGNNANV
jgi:hypothetical protein